MRAVGLICVNCYQEYELDLIYYCERCGFPLEVVYDSKYKKSFELSKGQGIWRYQLYLPVPMDSPKISLGEGNTPLIHARRLGEKLGFRNLYLKNEGQNPTGSFKDRPTSIGVSMAIALGVHTVVVSSTGNAAASLAAYSSHAGLEPYVFVAEHTIPTKLIQTLIHGARIITVEGSLSDAYNLARNVAKDRYWMNLTSTFLCPYTVEGDKTVAYELYEQLGSVPDYVIVPVSVGPLLVGIYKGYLELKERGLVDRLPRMIAGQALKCSPIARAFEQGEDNVRPWQGTDNTIAGGIADPLCGYEQDGTYTLRIIKKSGGAALALSDEEILDATRMLAQTEGIFSEPSSSVSIAALHSLKQQPGFSSDKIIVCIITGHGLKQAQIFEKDYSFPRPIKPSLEEVAKLLDKTLS